MPISPSPPPDSAFCHKPVPQAPDQFTALFSALTVVIFRLGGENFPRGLLPAARTSFSTAPSGVVTTKKPPTPPGRGEDADPLENRSVLPPSPPHSNAQTPSHPIAHSASSKMKFASLLGHRDASRRAIKKKTTACRAATDPTFRPRVLLRGGEKSGHRVCSVAELWGSSGYFRENCKTRGA